MCFFRNKNEHIAVMMTWTCFLTLIHRPDAHSYTEQMPVKGNHFTYAERVGAAFGWCYVRTQQRRHRVRVCQYVCVCLLLQDLII